MHDGFNFAENMTKLSKQLTKQLWYGLLARSSIIILNIIFYLNII